MTAPQQQQDALGFVHLVKRHFDRASIRLPSEVWVRMNAILAGEEEALKVSQQSNPATLREALEHARVFIQQAHDWMHTTKMRPLPEFLQATAIYKSTVDEALAASGSREYIPKVKIGYQQIWSIESNGSVTTCLRYISRREE